MSKFELYYPCKPFLVTQGWGIKNPMYVSLGFSEHNGVDFKPYAGAVTFNLYAPIKMEITEVSFTKTGGNYIRFVTPEKYVVLGTPCYVGGMLLHMKSQAVTVGQIVDVGDFLGIANNTGLSTGPHTHLSLYRLSEKANYSSNRLDTNPVNNFTFDPQPYWNGKFAQDVMAQRINQLISLLKRMLLITK